MSVLFVGVLDLSDVIYLMEGLLARIGSTLEKYLSLIRNCECESRSFRQLSVTQFGSAYAWGAYGRRFKSFHSDFGVSIMWCEKGFAKSLAVKGLRVRLTHTPLKERKTIVR